MAGSLALGSTLPEEAAGNSLRIPKKPFVCYADSMRDKIAWMRALNDAGRSQRGAAEVVYTACEGLYSAGLQAEDECYQVVLESADRREALRAFAAKEAPVFAGK